MTILYIDDDAEDIEIFMDALELIDPSVEFVSRNSPRQALCYLQSANVLPDIVLMDMNMPGMDGQLCLQEIRNDRTLNAVRVIVYSSSNFLQADVERLGATFIRKANSFNELCALIKGLISKHPD